MKEFIKLDSIDTYNKYYGMETLHPLVTVVDLRKATSMLDNVTIEYGVYAMFLKMGKYCHITYGRREYDYSEGTIVSFAPGQIVEVNSIGTDPQPYVLGILFHPDMIRGTDLAKNIHKYNFFSYSSNEALHLSEREKNIFMDCLNKIQMELEHVIDKHSRQLISMNIELLLNYCLRFYERQFITREDANKDILQKFEQLLNEYLDMPEKKGLPSVKYFADKVFLSPNYFGDLIKKETGKSPQEYIQFKLVERAKDLIIGTNKTMSEIAYELGFSYPQHFGRLFKKVTNMTPNEYRAAI